MVLGRLPTAVDRWQTAEGTWLGPWRFDGPATVQAAGDATENPYDRRQRLPRRAVRGGTATIAPTLAL